MMTPQRRIYPTLSIISFIPYYQTKLVFFFFLNSTRVGLLPPNYVYYILDYFGILFILDINSVLIEFILWDQRLLKGFILRNILRDSGTVKLHFLCHELCFNFLLINIENI